MATATQQEYVSHNGQLYMYWRGNFYLRSFNGDLTTVLDNTLVLELLPLLETDKTPTVQERMGQAMKIAIKAPDAPKAKKVVRKGRRIDITF